MLKALISETFTRPTNATTASGKSRIMFIDLAKGVCILLVIFSHLHYRYGGLPILLQLRMPLYFVLSGLFFKDYGGWYNLLVKKTNKLLVPFVTFYVIGGLFYWIQGLISPTLYPRHGFMLLNIFHTNLFPNGAVWFLLCLFWVNLLFVTICKITKVEWQRGLLVVCLTVAGFLISGDKEAYFLFFNSALLSLPFFYLGYRLRATDFLLPNRFDRYNWWISIGILCACGVALYFLGKTNINFHAAVFNGIPIVAYLISVLTVLSVLLICKEIVWLPFVSYFGRYSIIPLVVHSIYIDILAPIVKLTGIHIIGRHMIIFLVVVLLCWPTIHIVKTYLPHLSAQKDIFPSPTK